MKEIREITGMRGLASQAVIFFHFFAISPVLQVTALSTVAIPLSWDSGVDFFFVLSGFLLSIPFMELKKIELKKYYLKRGLRILPAYYVSLVFVVLFLSRNVTLPEVVASAFFSQNFFQSTFTSINGVYWTLAIEEIFYATLPLFAYFFVKGRWMYALPICITTSTIYRIVVFTVFQNDLYNLNFYLWQYPSYLEHYAIGASLAALFVAKKVEAGRFNTSRPLFGSIAILLFTQYFVGSHYIQNAYDTPFANLVFGAEYGALIFFTLSSPVAARLRSIFTNRISMAMGKLSYSTYIWHLPIEVTLFDFHLPIAQWLGASYLLTMMIATLSYLFVERPFLRLKDKISAGLLARGGKRGKRKGRPFPTPRPLPTIRSEN